MLLKELFPQAIVHIDGDAFFASCEMAKNPKLKGKPIVVGQERGIATAVSYEAKALGVVRGMTMRHIRETFPSVIIVPSDYDSYSLFTRKMYEIVRRYTSIVEEYSIDECFGDLTHLIEKELSDQKKLEKITHIGQSIKRDLEQDLDISFSVGIGPTKVLAKVASKWNKPSGFTVITGPTIEQYLEKLPVKKIWGIGSSTAYYLRKQGIETTLQLVLQTERWVDIHLPKPIHEIWYELKGVAIYDVNPDTKHLYKSISKTQSFKPTYSKSLLFSELSKNVERMCVKLRRHHLRARRISFFIKTQEFRYLGGEIGLPNAMAVPTEIIKLLKPQFERLFKPGTLYRASGVTAHAIIDDDHVTEDLFGNAKIISKISEIFLVNDKISEKLGRGIIFLASSLESRKYQKKTETPPTSNFPKFNIPFLGEAS